MFPSSIGRWLLAAAAVAVATAGAATTVHADAPRTFSITPQHGSASTGITASLSFKASAGDPCTTQQINFTWDGSPWASVAKPTFIAGNDTCTAYINQAPLASASWSGAHIVAASGALGQDSASTTFVVDGTATPPTTPTPTATVAPSPTRNPTAPNPTGTAAPSPTAPPSSTPSPSATATPSSTATATPPPSASPCRGSGAAACASAGAAAPSAPPPKPPPLALLAILGGSGIVLAGGGGAAWFLWTRRGPALPTAP